MKKLIIILSAAGVIFVGCKEKPPFIKLDNTNYVDSTYSVSGTLTTEPHNVLVEEFTGVSCTNCPAAHTTLLTAESTHEGRVNVIGLYVYNIIQTDPVAGAVYDFRDSTASTIGANVYGGIGSLPNGGVDRTPFNGSLLIQQGNWTNLISDGLNTVDPLNLKVESHTSASGARTIVATVVYTQPVTTPQNLSVVIVEDSLIDLQEFPFGVIQSGYVFTNVFRQMVTSPPYGDPIYPSVSAKTPGLALQRTFTYNLSSKIVNPAHCRVIAFVNSTVDKHVIQSCQTKL